MSKENEYKWRVGELCKAVYDNIGEGIIYRVTAVEENKHGQTCLEVLPVFGCFANIARRKKRSLGIGWCTPLSLVDLGNEYLKFGNFIKDEARSHGATLDEGHRLLQR